jgi:hypothetical protein
MNINDAFPSKWLKASDLQGRQPTMTIADVRFEEIGDGEKKPVVYFDGTDKGVVLNKTNATNISEGYGPDTTDWRGRKVVMFTTWVDFNGKSVEAIRMRPAPKQEFTSGLQQGKSVNAPLNTDDGGREFAPREAADLDDEIPL